VERVSIISTGQLAAWLGIPDSEDDVRLSFAVAATNRAIVSHCGRSFETTTSASASEREYRAKSYTICDVDDFHTTDGLVVKTGPGDGTYPDTVSSSDYFLEPVNGRQDGLTVPYRRIRGRSWIFTPDCAPTVQVTAPWGWAGFPAEVTQAALIKGARLFKRKDSIEGVLGGFQDFNAVRISNREDPDVVELLRYYRTAQAQLLTP
jgi:hypothetical protein